MVQAFGSNGFYPSLRDGVGLRRSEGRADRSGTESFQPEVKGRTVTAVAVMDEKTRWYTIPTAGLDDLPPCPLAGRVTSGSDMNDFPTGMMNDEKLEAIRLSEELLRVIQDKKGLETDWYQEGILSLRTKKVPS